MNALDPAAARQLQDRLRCLTALQFTRELESVQALCALLNACAGEKVDTKVFCAAYQRAYNAWLGCIGAGYDGFAQEVLAHVLFTDSPAAQLCARMDISALPYSLVRALAHDLGALGELTAVEPSAYFLLASRGGADADVYGQLPAWEARVDVPALDPRLEGAALCEGAVRDLCRFYQVHGTGIFAQYPGCTYVGVSDAHPLGLRGISRPDPLRLEDMVLYEAQRSALVENTRALLDGKKAANVLLFGDKGTGKSATCKALLSSFFMEGLRIVEVPLVNLTHLQEIFSVLRNQPGKFIVFVDDLAFSDSCPEYTALKTVLEGGLEARPHNVVVYATSNRRNIVRQRFSEREDDVNERDTLEEKFSLADRFDLRLSFQAPSQEEYLQIVRALLTAHGLDVAERWEEIAREACAFTVSHAGRSPRIARQFVDLYVSRMDGE
jgi:predicted AAA+ superfamily ATPase